MKTIVVDVTAEDIAAGKRQDCNNCPVANAVSRRFPEAKEIVAGGSRIDVHFDPLIKLSTGEQIAMYRGLTPGSVYHFMVQFDEGVEVSPFCFDLTLYPHASHTPPTRVVL